MLLFLCLWEVLNGTACLSTYQYLKLHILTSERYFKLPHWKIHISQKSFLFCFHEALSSFPKCGWRSFPSQRNTSQLQIHTLYMVHISVGKIIVTYLTQHLFLGEQVVQEGNLFSYLKWKFYLRSTIGINHARESG